MVDSNRRRAYLLKEIWLSNKSTPLRIDKLETRHSQEEKNMLHFTLSSSSQEKYKVLLHLFINWEEHRNSDQTYR